MYQSLEMLLTPLYAKHFLFLDLDEYTVQHVYSTYLNIPIFVSYIVMNHTHFLSVDTLPYPIIKHLTDWSFVEKTSVKQESNLK